MCFSVQNYIKSDRIKYRFRNNQKNEDIKNPILKGPLAELASGFCLLTNLSPFANTMIFV